MLEKSQTSKSYPIRRTSAADECWETGAGDARCGVNLVVLYHHRSSHATRAQATSLLCHANPSSSSSSSGGGSRSTHAIMW